MNANASNLNLLIKTAGRDGLYFAHTIVLNIYKSECFQRKI